MAEQTRERPSEINEGALWLGLLGGPVAWLAQLGLSYPLVPVSCQTEWGAIFHLVSLVAALATVAVGTVAWQTWQQARADGPQSDVRLGRQQFMALAGVLVSALFLATIVAQWLPVLFLSPCTYAP